MKECSVLLAVHSVSCQCTSEDTNGSPHVLPHASRGRDSRKGMCVVMTIYMCVCVCSATGDLGMELMGRKKPKKKDKTVTVRILCTYVAHIAHLQPHSLRHVLCLSVRSQMCLLKNQVPRLREMRLLCQHFSLQRTSLFRRERRGDAQ